MGAAAADTLRKRRARKVFENEQKGALSHGAEIVSFHQINGQTAEEHGIKMYGMEYEAEVKYPASPYRPAGETRKDKGVLRFEQTEKGWKAQDGEVY